MLGSRGYVLFTYLSLAEPRRIRLVLGFSVCSVYLNLIMHGEDLGELREMHNSNGCPGTLYMCLFYSREGPKNPSPGQQPVSAVVPIQDEGITLRLEH